MIRSINGEDIYNKMHDGISDSIDQWLTSVACLTSIDDCFDLIATLIDKSKSEEGLDVTYEIIMCAIELYLNQQDLSCIVGEDEEGNLTITVAAKGK